MNELVGILNKFDKEVERFKENPGFTGVFNLTNARGAILDAIFELMAVIPHNIPWDMITYLDIKMRPLGIFEPHGKNCPCVECTGSGREANDKWYRELLEREPFILRNILTKFDAIIREFETSPSNKGIAELVELKGHVEQAMYKMSLLGGVSVEDTTYMDLYLDTAFRRIGTYEGNDKCDCPEMDAWYSKVMA